MPKAKSSPLSTSKNQQFWLFKSEPEVFSIDDLAAAPRQTTHWDGVRNYQARNYLRDSMKLGDRVLYYHSSTAVPAIVGIATITREGYPDHTALDSRGDHYDPKSTSDNPIWFMVDIQLVERFPTAIPLPQLREIPQLSEMELLRRGSRLSVQPVRKAEYETILKIAGVKS